MFAFMSGTARGSGGLLHCNITYMRLSPRVVKGFCCDATKFAGGNFWNLVNLT